MLSGEETSGAMPAAHVSRDNSAAAAARQPGQLRQSESSPAEHLDNWPILREGEGGKLVGGTSALTDGIQSTARQWSPVGSSDCACVALM